MLMQCISTCRMFTGELWTQLNGQSINFLLHDCSCGLLNPYCARIAPGDSAESILTVLFHYRINVNLGFNFQNVQKQNDRNVQMLTRKNLSLPDMMHIFTNYQWKVWTWQIEEVFFTFLKRQEIFHLTKKTFEKRFMVERQIYI